MCWEYRRERKQCRRGEHAPDSPPQPGPDRPQPRAADGLGRRFPQDSGWPTRTGPQAAAASGGHGQHHRLTPTPGCSCSPRSRHRRALARTWGTGPRAPWGYRGSRRGRPHGRSSMEHGTTGSVPSTEGRAATATAAEMRKHPRVQGRVVGPPKEPREGDLTPATHEQTWETLWNQRRHKEASCFMTPRT